MAHQSHRCRHLSNINIMEAVLLHIGGSLTISNIDDHVSVAAMMAGGMLTGGSQEISGVIKRGKVYRDGHPEW